MTQKTNAVVVGAGVVGLTAAYLLQQKGFKVTLLDAAEQPGGLMRSKTSSYGYFDYGTHVGVATGEATLDDFLYHHEQLDLMKFTVGKSGNYYNNQLSEISPFLNLNHLDEDDYQSLAISLLRPQSEAHIHNLEDKFISLYGEAIFHRVIEPVVNKYFGLPAKKISASAYAFFDMNRLISFDAETTQRLKQVPEYDNCLGFHGATSGADKYYPSSGGIGAWYQALLDKTLASGVKYLGNCQVSAVNTLESKIVGVQTNLGDFTCQQFIWAVPSPLLGHLLHAKPRVAKPVYRATAIYDFTFDQPLKSDCYYINVHQPDKLSGRITLYQNLSVKSQLEGHFQVTVEVLQEAGFDFESRIDDIKLELESIGLIDAKYQCLYESVQPLNQGFPIISTETEQSVVNLNQALLDTFDNLSLLGRGNCQGFFMSSLLLQAFEKCNELEPV